MKRKVSENRIKLVVLPICVFAYLFLQSCSGRNTESSLKHSDVSIAKPELTVFKAPQEAPVNSSFSVFVRYDGGKWIDLHEYDAEVDGGYLKEPIHHMAFVSFDSDFSKRIDVKVIKNEGTINEVEIRPELSSVRPVVEKNTIEFSLTEASKISVEINGDLYNNLMVFANNPETEKVRPNDNSIIYFGPGVHKIGEDGKGTLQLKKNDKIYIAGGAIVYGTLSALGADNISVTGRGILCGGMYTDHAFPHPEGKSLISFSDIKKAKIEGITLLNTVGWNIHLNGCDSIECNNLKIMGWTINSDGINPQCSENIIIDDCFVRNFDDCISIKMNYGMGKNFKTRVSRNITVQNCIFWTDQGRSVLIGPESYIPGGGTFENITVKNIDVLYNENYDVDWAKGVLAINLGDSATARNITFDNIRVYRLGPKTNLITLTMDKYTYNLSEGKRMENIRFNRITLNSGQNLDNYIWGVSKLEIIDGVCFDNLKIDRLYVRNPREGRFDINEYAENIAFTTTNNN